MGSVPQDPTSRILVDMSRHSPRDIIHWLNQTLKGEEGGTLHVIVPLLEDASFWQNLQRLSHNVKLILKPQPDLGPSEQPSAACLSRYKSLDFVGILATAPSRTIERLVKRTPRPDIFVHEQDINEEFWHYLNSVSRTPLPAYVDLLIDPLQPLTQDLGLEVYANFEKDKAKYSQYNHAIEMALEDLHLSKPSLRILVIGPGRGPLLEMAMALGNPEDDIVAVERNTKCRDILESKIQNKTNVELRFQDVRDIPDANSFDLVVSELLGSFGCNEACPEILQIFSSSTAVMIPQECRSWLQPIYTPLPIVGERPYLVQLSTYREESEAQQVFEDVYPGQNSLNRAKTLSFQAPHSCNALLGYFEATLYGPYRIGILPSVAKDEYCSSWFPMLFPIPRTAGSFDVEFERVSTDSAMYYEWGNKWRRNKEGKEYQVRLKSN